MNPSKFKHGDAKGTLPRQESRYCNSTNPNNLASPSIWDFWREYFFRTLLLTTTNNTSRYSRKKWLYIFKQGLVAYGDLLVARRRSVGSTSGIYQYWYPKCLQDFPNAKMLDLLDGGPGCFL